MKRLLFAGAMGLINSASTVTFEATYSPNVNTDRNAGVELSTSGVAPLNFDLSAIGQSVNIDLFDIHLRESIGIDGFFNFNDLNETAISVDFSFTSPSEMGGTAFDTTEGQFTTFAGAGLDQLAIAWDSALSFDFGGISLELVLANLVIDESFFLGIFPSGRGTIQVRSLYLLAMVPLTYMSDARE